MEIVASSAPSRRPLQHHGHGLDDELAGRGARHELPGCAAIPAPYRERGQIAYETGKRIVEMVREDLKPSDILTREAFENAIVVNSRHRRLDQRARSTSTPSPAISACSSTIERLGDDRPQGAAARQPAAGRRISRRGVPPRRRRAGGGRRADEATACIHEDALTVNGKTHRRELPRPPTGDRDVIRPFDKPLQGDAGFIVLQGQSVRFARS